MERLRKASSLLFLDLVLGVDTPESWGASTLGQAHILPSSHSVIAAVLENWAAAPEVASVRVKRCEE